MSENNPSPSAVAEPSPPSSEVGSILAQRYEVVRELGRGGMGIVFLCKDLSSSERVALKRLRMPDEKSGSRDEESFWFLQEARAVACLDHPSIVRARDFGQLADGTPYLVMDVLPGRSVHEWMHTTKMAWNVIWALVDQVLAGLGHAHARGVIHGDLKPSNIMLDLASPASPRAYILDLGLAWLRHPRHDSRLDGAPAPEGSMHSGAGTVGWVAPEQIRRAATLVGPSTDLYALGCILYRILVGREVFEGSAQDVLRAHKRTPVAPLDLPPGVPVDASVFVQKLLAKKPWQRFEYAADARASWELVRPDDAPVIDAIFSPARAASAKVAPLSSRPAMGTMVAAARSLAPGLLGLRQAPLVAREQERTDLWNCVVEVAGAKPGSEAGRRMIGMIGEAGVGKSRLAEWLFEQVHEQGAMVPLRARYGRIPTPLDGVTGAVNAHYGLDGADRATIEQTLIQRWEVDPGDQGALSWVAATAEWLRPTPPGTQAPLGPTGKRFVLDTPELRWVVVQKVLERIGHERPVLLWFDDLHLSSPNTFEMLARLRQAPSNLRVLIVATARSEALATDLDAALRMESMMNIWSGRVIDLKPLAQDETQALLRATLPLHHDAVAQGVAQSRGNPLFALQLLHAWAGGGYLTLEAGRYRVPADALAGRAITTADLWDERLRAVPTDLRLAAYAAAALGEDIRGDVLKSLVGSLGLEPRDAVVALARAQILLQSGNDQFRWPHALLQEHLLGRLQERNDAPAVFRLAADALSGHPAVGSRRIMKHRVTNLLRAGDDELAARLMFKHIEGAWRRGRDTAATLRDLELLEGRVSGATAAEYAYWRAESLRHIGQLGDAESQAVIARDAFVGGHDRVRQAHALRLLGHIASDRGQPAQGRKLVAQSVTMFESLGDEAGAAQAKVVFGEIDYLLGDHQSARIVLHEASARCAVLGDPLGRAQCLILLAMISTAGGGYRRSRELLLEARAEFDGIGYRLGIAQCEVVLGHAHHRALEMDESKRFVLSARAAFRELSNPRGEGACERLLAMIAIDRADIEAATAHAMVAARIYDRLKDPWGIVEGRLLLAQVALCRAGVNERTKAQEVASARKTLEECEAIDVDEAEPRQHRHLTLAWLANLEQRWDDALRELDLARAEFGDGRRTGDHAPQLLARFAQMPWTEAAADRIESWLQTLDHSNPDGTQSVMVQPPR